MRKTCAQLLRRQIKTSQINPVYSVGKITLVILSLTLLLTQTFSTRVFAKPQESILAIKPVLCGKLTFISLEGSNTQLLGLVPCGESKPYIFEQRPAELYNSYRFSNAVVGSGTKVKTVKYGYLNTYIKGWDGYIQLNSCSECSSGPAQTVPPPVVTQEPIAPPVLTVDLDRARKAIQAKSELIPGMEAVSVPIGIFNADITAKGYNEAGARSLLERMNILVSQETITQQEVEALERFTIQEKALAAMLKDYTTISATIADADIDRFNTLLGFSNVLGIHWSKCSGFIIFCPIMQSKVTDLTAGLIQKLSQQMLQGLGDQTIARDAGDVLVRYQLETVTKGSQLFDLLKDTWLKTAFTKLNIQAYLTLTQPLLDKGVRSANLTTSGGDRWNITGDTNRAALLVDEMIQKSRWQNEDASGRHSDFKRASDIAAIFQDMASLASYPGNFISLAVNIGTRVEGIIVNSFMIHFNENNLKCVYYLVGRASEMSFDSQQPSEDCRYTSGWIPENPAHFMFVSWQSSPPNSQLWMSFLTNAEQYQQDLEAVSQAILNMDLNAADTAIRRLNQSLANVSADINGMQAIVASRQTTSPQEINFIQSTTAFDFKNIYLYLAVSEALMAQQSGSQPSVDVPQMAQNALVSLSLVEQLASGHDLNPPQDKPILILPSLLIENQNNQQLHIETLIKNVGGLEAKDVLVMLVTDSQQQPIAAYSSLGSGSNQTVAADVPMPASLAVNIQVWAGGVLADSRIQKIPQAMPAAAIQTTPATPPQAKLPSGICRGIFGFTALPLVVFILKRKKPKGN